MKKNYGRTVLSFKTHDGIEVDVLEPVQKFETNDIKPLVFPTVNTADIDRIIN